MFSSVEVTRPTDVFVDYRRLARGRCVPPAIAGGLQGRVDRAVGSRADPQPPAAGGLQPLGPVAFDEPHDADAGAEALLGVGALDRMISTSAEVLRPISPACRVIRSGVQSA